MVSVASASARGQESMGRMSQHPRTHVSSHPRTHRIGIRLLRAQYMALAKTELLGMRIPDRAPCLKAMLVLHPALSSRRLRWGMNVGPMRRGPDRHLVIQEIGRETKGSREAGVRRTHSPSWQSVRVRGDQAR